MSDTVWAAIDNTNRILEPLHWTEDEAREAHPGCVDFEPMLVEGTRETQ